MISAPEQTSQEGNECTTLHTLLYLINEQDGINEYNGKFLIINNRSGWNKLAEGANFEALINKQGGNIRNMKGKFVKTIKNQRFTLIVSMLMHHLDSNCKKSY